MQSPISPLAPSSSTLSFLPWRTWSVPVDWTSVRRRICGLLNKVTPVNADRIADQFAELAVALERSGDHAAVESCARILVQRCVIDPCHTGLLARLAQRASDEAEGASLRWRAVDPYYVEDPATSLSTVLRDALLRELELSLRGGRERDACALAVFVGDLLVLGVLSCDDVQDTINLLYQGVLRNTESYCVILCRMLGRIVSSSEASHIIAAFALVTRTEGVLEEDTVSLKIRYMMMNMLDQCLYPKPGDAFGSDLRRSQAYGFEDDVDHGDMPLSPVAIVHPEPSGIGKHIHSVDRLFAARNLSELEQLFLALQPGEHPHITSHLIGAALASGDEADVSLVTSFFALPSVRQFHAVHSSRKAFLTHVTMLEDTVLDVPSVYRTMASLLQAADLPRDVLEDLASRIIVRENAARDRLLEEFASLSAYQVEDASDHVDVTAERSGGEESASDYAYAY